MKNVPLKFSDTEDDSILVGPILDHLIQLGVNLENTKIQYFSEEDQIKCLVGICGKSIDSEACISIDEISMNKNKAVLQLFSFK